VPDVGDAESLFDGANPCELVALMAANNETGVLGPFDACASACAERGTAFLCDASQWLGRLPARELPATAFIVGCAHKFGGPKGVGFIRLPAASGDFRGALGGGQEGGRRGGTENLPGIAAMVAALEHGDAAARAGSETGARAACRDAFVERVRRAIPGSRVNGAGAPRLWNTVSLTLPLHENTRWVTRLDRVGWAVSTGSACATGSGAPSHVLAAMGLDPAQARRTIRLSAGWETTESEWLGLAAAIEQAWLELAGDAAGARIVIPPDSQ
jgi:cysteine desulfurase